mgnify:CR=1 FL=1
MAISRGSMTKELFGNRQKAKKPKKMAMGGTPTPSDMMNQRGRDIAAQAQQGGMKMAINAPSRIVPTAPSSYATGTPMMPNPQGMKKGGSVRGCGCATRGKSGAKVY